MGTAIAPLWPSQQHDAFQQALRHHGRQWNAVGAACGVDADEAQNYFLAIKARINRAKTKHSPRDLYTSMPDPDAQACATPVSRDLYASLPDPGQQKLSAKKRRALLKKQNAEQPSALHSPHDLYTSMPDPDAQASATPVHRDLHASLPDPGQKLSAKKRRALLEKQNAEPLGALQPKQFHANSPLAPKRLSAKKQRMLREKQAADAVAADKLRADLIHEKETADAHKAQHRQAATARKIEIDMNWEDTANGTRQLVVGQLQANSPPHTEEELTPTQRTVDLAFYLSALFSGGLLVPEIGDGTEEAIGESNSASRSLTYYLTEPDRLRREEEQRVAAAAKAAKTSLATLMQEYAKSG
jgi:hypothetical protein